MIPHTSKPLRITFGMIVLNGEPFIRYNLRSIYPWAHQIVVVEGACKAASAVADVKGHSIDGTLEVLRCFQLEEDPDKKLIIVTAEDEGHQDGFWPGEKLEMSQAYAKRATGNYLWQVDVDEFYREEDMPAIIKLIESGISQISFPLKQFWGGIGLRENGEFLRIHFNQVHRIFAWEKQGYHYTTHRPPTVIDDKQMDLRLQKWIDGPSMKAKKIFMYHYCMLLPKQVRQKSSYYAHVDWAEYEKMEIWADNAYFKFLKPFEVCDVLPIPMSWLEEYHGTHPKQILNMVENILNGRHPNIELRPTEDILHVIRTPQYHFGRFLRKILVELILNYNRGKSLVRHGFRLCHSILETIKSLILIIARKKKPADTTQLHLIKLFVSNVFLKFKMKWVQRERFVYWGNMRHLTPINRFFGLNRGTPIDRYYIESFLSRYRTDVKGNVMEIGDSNYTQMFGGFKVVKSDVLHVTNDNPNATLIGNLSTGEGIPSNRFDCMILTQTLPFIYDIHSAIANAYTALKPEGKLLITLSGISQISRYDMERWGDYWRFTNLSALRIFGDIFGLENVTVETHGNVLVACAFLQGLAAKELKQSELDYKDPDYQVIITVRAIKRKELNSCVE